MVENIFRKICENYEAIEKANDNIKVLTSNPEMNKYTFLDKYPIHISSDVTKDGVVV